MDAFGDKFVSVVIPAYNEEGNVPLLMEKMDRTFRNNDIRGEAVLVNDGSTDGTYEEGKKSAQKFGFVNLVSHQQRRGLTQALMTGFKHSRGDVIVFLCADLQSDPEEDVPKLLSEIEKGSDVVLGWRQGRKKDTRFFVSKIYHFLTRSLFGITVHDLNWIKAFRREVVKKMRLRSDWHRYIAVLAASEGYRISEVKTNCYPRNSGKSKFGTGRILAGFLDLLTVKFQISFHKKPMFFFGTLGLIFILLGAAVGFAMTFLWFWTDYQYTAPNYLLFLVTILVVSGIQLFSLGFLAESLVSYMEKKLEEKE